MRKIFNDSALQRHFVEKGYLRVPMLSDDEIAYQYSRLAELRQADNFAPPGRDGFE